MKEQAMETRVSEQAIREIYEVTSARGLSFEDRLGTLLSLGCQRFQLPIGLLTQVREDSLEIVVCHPTNTGLTKGVRVPLEQTFCSATLTAEGPIAFEHAGVSEWVKHPAYETLQLEAYLGTKVMTGEDVYGTLCFTSPVPYEGIFTAADKDYLQLMSRWVESELERRSTEAALLDRNRLLGLDAEVASVILHGTGFRAMLQGCTEAIVKHLDAAFARIWTLNAKEQTLELQASAGMYTNLKGRHNRVAVGQYKIGKIAADKKPHLTNAVIGDPRVHDQEWAKREGMVAFAGYPLLKGDEVIGVMALFARHPLTEFTLEGLRIVADRIALAVQRQAATDALSRSEHLLRSIINNSPAVIYVKWANGRYLMINSQYEKLFHISGEQMRGKTDHDIFPKEIADVFRANDETVLATKAAVESEEYAPHDDGLHAYISVKFPLLDVQGMPYATCGISTDITDLKRTEEELHKSEAKTISVLKQSDSLKTAILDSVSHELRTPLASIKSTVSALMGHRSKGNLALYDELLKGVNHEIDALSRLVDNLLDMAKVAAASPELHYEEHLFEDLLEGALSRFASELKVRKLDLDLPSDLPTIWVDGPQIQLVLVNLIENAIKYSIVHTPIRIQGRVKGEELEVRVVSMGEVVPEEDRTRIFERFYRVPTKRGRTIRGTGLGLAICQSIVKSHSGRIWAESPAKWTTVIIFTLPIDPRPSSPSNGPQ